jgi:hypothetical protein
MQQPNMQSLRTRHRKITGCRACFAAKKRDYGIWKSDPDCRPVQAAVLVHCTITWRQPGLTRGFMTLLETLKPDTQTHKHTVVFVQNLFFVLHMLTMYFFLLILETKYLARNQCRNLRADILPLICGVPIFEVYDYTYVYLL